MESWLYSCDLAFLTWVWCEKAEVMMLEVTQETHGRHPFHSINVLHVMAPGTTFYLTRLTTPYNAWQNLTCNVRTLYCISWHQQSYGTLWWPGDTIHCAKRSTTTEHCGRVLCAPQKYRQPKFYIVPSPWNCTHKKYNHAASQKYKHNTTKKAHCGHVFLNLNIFPFIQGWRKEKTNQLSVKLAKPSINSPSRMCKYELSTWVQNSVMIRARGGGGRAW